MYQIYNHKFESYGIKFQEFHKTARIAATFSAIYRTICDVTDCDTGEVLITYDSGLRIWKASDVPNV